jgi:hypothetical protein
LASAEQKLSNVRALETVTKVCADGRTPVAPLNAWFSLAPIEPKGGYWYFGLECLECQQFSPAFQDYSDGNLGKAFKGGGVVAVCYLCKKENRCQSENLDSRQWPLKHGEKQPLTHYAASPPRKYQDDPEQRPVRGPLHHYTSVEALRAIISSKTLRATNVYYLNDSSESELGLLLMRQVAVEARDTSKGLDAEFLDFFITWFDRRGRDGPAVYVLSFSEAHDDLGQWRAYTPYGKGVCISIDSMFLVERMQEHGWNFQHCRYNQTSQLAWAESILSRLRREVALQRESRASNSDQLFNDVLQANLSDLLGVAATIKHEAFSSEQEVRFISPMIAPDDPRVAYRDGKTTRIPYVPFRLVNSEGRIAVREIMVGPCPDQSPILGEVLGIATGARGSGTCQLSASKIPYRQP